MRLLGDVKLVGGARTESYLVYAVAGALLMAGPFWLFLHDSRYPFRPEYFLLVAGAALLGALGLVVAHRIGGLVETACFAVALYLFLDMQSAFFEAHVKTLLLVAILFVLAHLLRARRAAITAISLGAFYAASLPRLGGEPEVRRSATPVATADSTRPVLLHVILDEQWGIGGLRLEGDTSTASYLSDFYLRRGFELYPAAYSRWGRTMESITDMLSMGNASSLEPGRPTRRSRLRKTIPYFELLRSRGYAIRVFQSGFLDYCDAPASPVASCETQSGNSAANIGYLDGPVGARAMLVSRYFLNLRSHVYRAVHEDPVQWRRAGTGGALRELEHLRESIETGPRSGVAYFVHVLLPHRPLEVDRECRLIRDPRRRIGELPTRVGDSAWAATLVMVDDQIRCAHLALGRALDALDSTAGRGNSIVIVHGDHGGRFFKQAPASMGVAVDDRQLSARFSTLLAVRRPGAPAGVRPEPVPTQDFIWRLAQQDFTGAVPSDYEHYVRASGWYATPVDSLRQLTTQTMPWVR